MGIVSVENSSNVKVSSRDFQISKIRCRAIVHPHLSDEEVGQHGVLDAQGGSKDGVKCTEVKFFFDDEISRCLEVNSTLQTVPFFLFWSKHSRVLAFRPAEIVRIQRVERRGCESSLTRGEGGCLEMQGAEAQIRLNCNRSCNK